MGPQKFEPPAEPASAVKAASNQLQDRRVFQWLGREPRLQSWPMLMLRCFRGSSINLLKLFKKLKTKRVPSCTAPLNIMKM